jgi:hypothetical protein
MLVPLGRIVLAHDQLGRLSPDVVGRFVLGEQLVVALCTIAIALIVTGPDVGAVGTAARAYLRSLPRFGTVAVVFAFAEFLLPRFVVELGRVVGSLLALAATLVVWLPFSVVLELALVGVAIEDVGPVTAFHAAFRRAWRAGYVRVFGFAVLLGLLAIVPVVAALLLSPFAGLMQSVVPEGVVAEIVDSVAAVVYAIFSTYLAALVTGAAFWFADLDVAEAETTAAE